jgi:Trk K+ transport system NAD-binding subunit
LREITFPADCNIVSIFRGGEAVLPRGETSFEAADQVLALVKRPTEQELRRLLLGDS